MIIAREDNLHLKVTDTENNKSFSLYWPEGKTIHSKSNLCEVINLALFTQSWNENEENFKSLLC